MRRIGKVDFESNEILEYMDIDENSIDMEYEFEISDSMRIFTQCSNPSIWVAPSFIVNNETRLRVKPTKTEHGWLFNLVPRKELVEGAVYLITDHLTYKYNLRFNET